jgi:ABC-type thiamine transport system ATPase subunit
MTPPLFACDRPRFEGSPQELGVFDADGGWLVLVGSWGPLFQLLAGKQRLLGGSILLGGQPAQSAVGAGHVGLLPKDAPLPPAWTLQDTLCHGAALLGLSARQAKESARATARELGLGEQLPRPLARLSVAERRLAGVALALLGEPELVALEEPFSGLEPSAQRLLASVLERALRGRRALVSVAELPGSIEQDGFVQHCAELLFATERGLAARGSYAELTSGAAHFSVVVSRHADALCARLAELGYGVQPRRAAAGVLLADPGALGTRPVLEAALALDAPIVELSPVLARPEAALATGQPPVGASSSGNGA